jgi:hypothetical protein
MLTEEQRRIAEQGLSQNERVGRDRMARFPDLSQPAIRLQVQGNNPADAQPTRQNDEDSKLLSFRQLQGNLEPADAQPININTNPIRPGGNQGGGRNPSQTYQNQENRSFSNSYGNSYGNSMSGYQPQYGSRGGFGMQQPMYGGGMGIMGLQSPFGGYGMQSPFGSYGGGMQQPTYVWWYAARIWNAVSIRWIWNATASVPEQPI